MSNIRKTGRPGRTAIRLLAVPLAAVAAIASAAETTLSTVTVEAETEKTAKETYQATTTRIGKGNQELRDIPQSVTVVTERLIDDRNLDTLKETLHNTAGISFQAAEGQEEDIRLRGFSLQASGDIFIDGMRDPAFYERDTFNYDRLEVLRGSASMLFGRGSTGGAVNQVSKEPFLMNQNELTGTIGSGGYARMVGKGYSSDIVAGHGGGFYLNAEFAGRVVRWLPAAPAELMVIAELERARSLATWQAAAGAGVLIGALKGIGRWHPTIAPQFMRWPLEMSVDIHWTPKG